MLFALPNVKRNHDTLPRGDCVVAHVRALFCSSSDVTGYVAEVAKRKWKLCDRGSRIGVKRLKEAIKHQTLHVRMLDNGTAAKNG